MKIDARIRAIISEIEGEKLVDIGCDHGKVIAFALKLGKVKSALGVDISEKSLQKARVLCDSMGVEAEFLTANGKDVQLKDFDVAVIAGLGGIEIVEILKDNKEFPKHMILVPHQDPMILRMFLNQNKLYAQKDYVVEVGTHFYDIIVTGNGLPYIETELYFGKNAPMSDAYCKWLKVRLSAVLQIVDNNPKVSDEMKREQEMLIRCLS